MLPELRPVSRLLHEAVREGVRDAWERFCETALAQLGDGRYAAVEGDGPAARVREAVDEYRALVRRSDPFADRLGPLLEEHTGRSARALSGQFFTPEDVGALMMALTVSEWTPGPRPDGGLSRWHDPALGCGALLMRLLDTVVDRFGAQAAGWWSLSGVDLDRRCAVAAAVQLWTALDATGVCPGEVVIAHGNVLTLDCRSLVIHLMSRDLPPAMATPIYDTADGLAPAWLIRPGRIVTRVFPPRAPQ